MTIKKTCKIIVDIAITMIFAVLLIPRVVDTSTHELLGIIIAPIVALHILLNWKWVKATITSMRRGKATEKSQQMFRLVIGLAVSLVITIISGLLLSNALDGAALSHGLGHSMQGGIMPAMAVHRLSSMACMVFIILHIKVHWSYIKAIFKKKGQ
jgi:hypothetical protein